MIVFTNITRKLQLKKMKVISFGIKNKLSNIKLIQLKKLINKFELKIKVDDFKTSFIQLTSTLIIYTIF